MIRKLLLRRRMRAAGVGTNRFMAECNHLGEASDAARAHRPPLRTGARRASS